MKLWNGFRNETVASDRQRLFKFDQSLGQLTSSGSQLTQFVFFAGTLAFDAAVDAFFFWNR